MPLGDCYEAAGKWFLDNAMNVFTAKPKDPDLRLVHGEVMGQGPLAGVGFGHAWVEDGDMVIDPSNDKLTRMPKQLYYLLGKIDRIDNVHRYDVPTFRRRIATYQHWGPWDLTTSTGL